MLGGPDEIKVRNWEIKGEINSFRQGLVVGTRERFENFTYKRQLDQAKALRE